MFNMDYPITCYDPSFASSLKSFWQNWMVTKIIILGQLRTTFICRFATIYIYTYASLIFALALIIVKVIIKCIQVQWRRGGTVTSARFSPPQRVTRIFLESSTRTLCISTSTTTTTTSTNKSYHYNFSVFRKSLAPLFMRVCAVYFRRLNIFSGKLLSC